jgi:hypothetical protein
MGIFGGKSRSGAQGATLPAAFAVMRRQRENARGQLKPERGNEKRNRDQAQIQQGGLAQEKMGDHERPDDDESSQELVTFDFLAEEILKFCSGRTIDGLTHAPTSNSSGQSACA